MTTEPLHRDIEEQIDSVLLQFIAEYHQGLNELAGHGTAIEQAKATLLTLIREREDAARIDEIKTLRRKMESSSYDVGMGAWTVLHNREESLNALEGNKS